MQTSHKNREDFDKLILLDLIALYGTLYSTKRNYTLFLRSRESVTNIQCAICYKRSLRFLKN